MRVLKVARWLYNAVQGGDISEREDGTCEWIYDHPEYRSWRDAKYSQCLWIQGNIGRDAPARLYPTLTNSIQGSGKTVLTNYLSKTAETEIVFTHYFRNYVDPQSSRGKSLPLSVLSQILQTQALAKHDRFSRVFKKLVLLSHAYDSSQDCPLDEMLTILEMFLELIPRYTLLVDALDECIDIDANNGNSDSERLINFLVDLGARQETRVILLSRKHAHFDIRNCFRISMDQSTVESDIALYLKRQVHARNLCEVEHDILERAKSNCQGMFLWAKLVLLHVEKAPTINDMKDRLASFPPRLSDSYNHILRETESCLHDDELRLRREIFLILLGAHKLLTADEISEAIALNKRGSRVDVRDKLRTPQRQIRKLCGDLVLTGDHVQFFHSSAKEYLLQHECLRSSKARMCLSMEDSHAYLARKTLSKLTQPEYRVWTCPAALRRKHLLPGGVVMKAIEEILDNTLEEIKKVRVLYEYACLHWQDHLTKLERPSEETIALLRQFLTGNELVTWSETLFDLREQSGISTQVEVRAVLRSWYNNTLSPDIRDAVPANDYFELSHNNLSRELAQLGEDNVLPYLPFIRLGDYFNVGSENLEEYQKGYDYKEKVVNGFGEVLGQRNPLTLRARTNLYQEFFWQLRVDEAEKGLSEVSSIQLEVVGKSRPDYYLTLHLLGLAQFRTNKYDSADSTLKESARGIGELLGRTSSKFFMTQLYNGYVLEAQMKFSRAYYFYENIWSQWVNITSKQHPLSLMAQTAQGSLFRKQGKFAEAQEALATSWDERKRLWTIENNVSVDSGIQLASLYWDMNRLQDCARLLNETSRSSIFPDAFERTCQIAHLRALVDFSLGDYSGPKMALLNLIDQSTGSNRDRNNRALLWVRITLADAMRDHDESDRALMLFAELVKPIRASRASSTLDDEPEPPSQLRVAEQALRFVKAADQEAAARLLEENQLQWACTRDFWINSGGPITDTGVLRESRQVWKVS